MYTLDQLVELPRIEAEVGSLRDSHYGSSGSRRRRLEEMRKRVEIEELLKSGRGIEAICSHVFEGQEELSRRCEPVIRVLEKDDKGNFSPYGIDNFRGTVRKSIDQGVEYEITFLKIGRDENNPRILSLTDKDTGKMAIFSY